jgi:hypothetical protein
MGWTARAWTSVFPLSNWSFQLLALTNSAVGLWAVDLISRRFVKGDKRAIVLLLLMLTPVYQFYAQRFNANAVLLSVWPIATYCFLRSFETRAPGWAILAGATAALAMLGKYYSAFLIVSFFLAAVCHPQRRAYFGSWAPWISTAVGLVALAPHIYWLATTGAMPFSYALEAHEGKASNPPLVEALLFILGITAAMVFPIVTWMLMAGSRLKRFPDDFRAMNPGLWLLFMIGVGTIILPMIVCAWLRTDMPSIWAFQGLFLFVIPIVCGASYPIERFYTVNLAAMVLGIAAVAVFVAAPVHAYYRNTHLLHEGRNVYRLAATELTQRWHELSDTPLPGVGGDDAFAFAMAFYSPDHPDYEAHLIQTGGVPSALDFKRGWTALCRDEQEGCTGGIERNAARASRFIRLEFVLQSTLLGWPGGTERLAVVIVPPAAGGTATPSGPAKE